MAILPLVIAPDPFLKQKSKPVAVVDSEIRKLCADMLETMYANHGIGLAAVQVGVLKRVIVVDIGNASPRYFTEDEIEEMEKTRKPNPVFLINPEIVESSDESIEFMEGCLSFPEQYSEVERPAVITVEFLNEKGEKKTIKAKGLAAVCIQHEIDHINGVVFVDHISKLKRDMIMKKLTKAKKLGTIQPEEKPVKL